MPFGRMTGKCTEKTAPPPATPTWGMVPIQVQNRLFHGCFPRGGILQTRILFLLILMGLIFIDPGWHENWPCGGLGSNFDVATSQLGRLGQVISSLRASVSSSFKRGLNMRGNERSYVGGPSAMPRIRPLECPVFFSFSVLEIVS